jgi:hypothetical protein
MYALLVLAAMHMACISGLAQSPSPHWQKGTVIAVETHLYAQGERASHTVQYDISIQVDGTIYEVLYSPPPNSTFAGYSPGTDLLVAIGNHTLTVNSKQSGIIEVPIVHRRDVKGSRSFPSTN